MVNEMTELSGSAGPTDTRYVPAAKNVAVSRPNSNASAVRRPSGETTSKMRSFGCVAANRVDSPGASVTVKQAGADREVCAWADSPLRREIHGAAHTSATTCDAIAKNVKHLVIGGDIALYKTGIGSIFDLPQFEKSRAPERAASLARTPASLLVPGTGTLLDDTAIAIIRRPRRRRKQKTKHDKNERHVLLLCPGSEQPGRP